MLNSECSKAAQEKQCQSMQIDGSSAIDIMHFAPEGAII
jgi:hypothetical protein